MPKRRLNPKTNNIRWTLSVVEHWCQFADQTGFQPLGEHVGFVKNLFYNNWKECIVCNGSGVIDPIKPKDHEDWRNWDDCKECSHLGGKYTGSEDDWKKFVFTVINEYPNSACGHTKDRYKNIYQELKKHD